MIKPMSSFKSNGRLRQSAPWHSRCGDSRLGSISPQPGKSRGVASGIDRLGGRLCLCWFALASPNGRGGSPCPRPSRQPQAQQSAPVRASCRSSYLPAPLGASVASAAPTTLQRRGLAGHPRRGERCCRESWQLTEYYRWGAL